MYRPAEENEILWKRWTRNAQRNPARDAIIHWVAGEEPFRWTFSALITAAEHVAARLLEHDIRKGDVCAIILRHNHNLYPLYLAISSVGAIPAILAYPNARLHPDKFRPGNQKVCPGAPVWIGFSRNATLNRRFARPLKSETVH